MKKLIAAACFVLSGFLSFGQEVDSTQIFIDQIESSINYQTGKISFDSIGVIEVPAGYKYVDAEQSKYILTELWGNPDGECLGMLMPEASGVFSTDSYVFIIEYDPMGYVEDDDADDIDYDDLLKTMKEDTKKESENREKGGFGTIELIQWASKPYYDSDKKTLHWAKEYSFNGDSTHTLNYNVRILGRKGVLVMNAVSSIDQLPKVQSNIDKVHSSFSFNDGLKYADFDPDIDEVAAWTIGGLVAGKLLAKAGILALLLKNIKLILLALGAGGAAVYRWFTGKKKEETPVATNNNTPTPPAAS